MKPNYRLTPKPGIAKAGRVIKTNSKPVIIVGKASRVLKAANDGILKEQAVKKVIIKKPLKQKPPPPNRRRAPSRGVVRASPLRQRKEAEMGRYKKAVGELKNCGVGRLLIMVACGPSILEVDLPKLKSHPLIDMMSINKPDPRIHPTKYWAFCDQSQYLRNSNTFDKFPNTIINAWSVRARHPKQLLIRNKSGRGFSKNLAKGYFIGRSTTFANMQTAYWMNYDKVYIFGCDMCKPSSYDTGKLHFYGTNPDVDPSVRAKRFQKEAEHYMNGAKQLDAMERQKFVFCSSYNPWPFIKQFGQLDHKIAVEHVLAKADEMLKNKK